MRKQQETRPGAHVRPGGRSLNLGDEDLAQRLAVAIQPAGGKATG